MAGFDGNFVEVDALDLYVRRCMTGSEEPENMFPLRDEALPHGVGLAGPGGANVGDVIDSGVRHSSDPASRSRLDLGYAHAKHR